MCYNLTPLLVYCILLQDANPYQGFLSEKRADSLSEKRNIAPATPASCRGLCVCYAVYYTTETKSREGVV
jgi:hypothetical protein